MCLSGGSPPPATPVPATAPAPPSLPAEQQKPGIRRKRENRANFGNEDGPSTRRNEGGSGLNNNGSMGSGLNKM